MNVYVLHMALYYRVTGVHIGQLESVTMVQMLAFVFQFTLIGRKGFCTILN